MFSYISLIMTLGITLSGDALFNVAIIWRVLATGGSPKTLALFLCLIVLLTFVLQKYSRSAKAFFGRDPRHAFAMIRVIGVVSSLAFIPLLWNETGAKLYIAGMFFSAISFFSTLTVEAMIGQEVIAQRLSSSKASRILQTAIQIAAFLGASLAGFVLDISGMKSIFVVNAVTYASGVLIYSLLLNTTNHSDHVSFTSTENVRHQDAHPMRLWFSLLGLLFLTCQIAAFNFLVPQIAQHEKMWTATQFGWIDAAAGLGAFLCTFIVTNKGIFSKLWLCSFLGILASDIAFHFFSFAYAMVPVTLVLGYCVNTYRIKQREFIYEAVSTTQELYEWIGRITVMTTFVKAFFPLILIEMTFSPSITFALCGVVIGSAMLMCECAYQYYQTIYWEKFT